MPGALRDGVPDLTGPPAVAASALSSVLARSAPVEVVGGRDQEMSRPHRRPHHGEHVKLKKYILYFLQILYFLI